MVAHDQSDAYDFDPRVLDLDADSRPGDLQTLVQEMSRRISVAIERELAGAFAADRDGVDIYRISSYEDPHGRLLEKATSLADFCVLDDAFDPVIYARRWDADGTGEPSGGNALKTTAERYDFRGMQYTDIHPQRAGDGFGEE